MSDFIKARHSIRKFKSDKVSKEQLNQLLDAAMHAPSACNTRPWEFIVVTKREVLDEIARTHAHAAMCATAAAAIIVVALPQEAPLPNGFFPQDCGAATENILLEAANIGLGTCWCGVYPKEDKMESIAKLVGISAPKLAFNVIAVGVPDDEPETRGFFDAAKVTYI